MKLLFHCKDICQRSELANGMQLSSSEETVPNIASKFETCWQIKQVKYLFHLLFKSFFEMIVY